MFVHLLQWAFPLCAFTVWVAFAFHGVTTGDVTLAGFWALVFSGNSVLLWFRPGLFLRGYFVSVFVAVALDPLFACINYGGVHFETYSACVEAGYRSLAVILWLIGSFNVFLIGRQFVNVARTWRAARAVIALHRHALLCSLVTTLGLVITI